jgi:hypothetical protein
MITLMKINMKINKELDKIRLKLHDYNKINIKKTKRHH